MVKTDVIDVYQIDITELGTWGIFKSNHELTIEWPHYFEAEIFQAQLVYNPDIFGGTIKINFSNGLPDNDVDIETTPCHFGGTRKWFICPMQVSPKCSVRIRKLYFKNDWMGCRECCELTYRSRQLNRRNALYVCMLALERADDATNEIASLRMKYYRGRETKRFAAARLKHKKAMDTIRRQDI